MKRTEPQSLARIIDMAFEQSGVAETVNRQKACSLWPEIVGPGVNRLTMRRYVDGATLHVYITSAVLKNELQMQRSALIEAINQAAGCTAITDLKIH